MNVDLFYITEQPPEFGSLFNGVFDLSEMNRKGKLFSSTDEMKFLLERGESEFLLVQIKKNKATLFESAAKLLMEIACDAKASFVYSDFFEKENNSFIMHPLINYQLGSVRDDFDFGSFVLLERKAVEKYFNETKNSAPLEFSALYELRLFLSRNGKILRIPEPLYFIEPNNKRKSGEEIFDYVKREFIAVQKEREKVFTEHLKKIGAYILPEKKKVKFEIDKFPVTASVIIPVKNRASTIADAVKSALSQKTNFDFNVIVVNNHSSDGTGAVLKTLAKENEKLIHIIPKAKHLGIGGCWDLAINDARCGAFAAQLDSDDLYSSENVLQKIVDKFLETGAAAVVGSYVTTDFELNEIPPGIVKHEEWSDENGANNALRINGFGAPRAFYTEIIRKIGFPDVSYGEDYSAMLALTREYPLARIYEPLYYARRWKGNSDADLPLEKKNEFNFYKDFLRSAEIEARKYLNNE